MLGRRSAIINFGVFRTVLGFFCVQSSGMADKEKNMTKVAAVQMQGRVADVAYNLAHIRELLQEAVRQGAKVVALPEFFTTPIVQNEKLWQCALPPDNAALDLLVEFACDYQLLVGGSYLEKRGADVFNCYVLVRPDGRVTRHDKDLPTMIENAYYIGGNDAGWHDTTLGRVGTAVCWETIRTQTVRRLQGRVDFLMTGSHWWAPPGDWKVLCGFLRTMDTMNRDIMRNTPATFAKLLGVANIHAAHSGRLVGSIPALPTSWARLPFNSYLVGETQIVDANGTVLTRLSAEQGAGVISAELDLTQKRPEQALPARFLDPRVTMAFSALLAATK